MNRLIPYLKQIDILFFYLSIFTLTQSIKLSSKFLFIALALGLIKSIYTKNFSWFRKQKAVLLIYSIFLIYIFTQGIIIDGFLTFFQSFEKYYAPYLIFLLLPIFFQDDNKVKYLPKILIAGILFTGLLILIKSLIQLEFYDRSQVLATFKLHHLYVSLYVLFTINYLLSNILKIREKKQQLYRLGLVILLSLVLVFFKSKAAIAILFLLFGYHALSLIKWNFKKIVAFAMSIGIILTVFSKFFLELYMRAIDFRGRIWSTGVDLIQQAPFFGYGGSKEHYVINRAHFINGNYDFLDRNLNSHNQYLTFLIKFGLIGLVLILSSYLTPIFRMKKQLKKEYIGFLILMGLMVFIESFYNRHHGIVFCTIFLFYYNSIVQINKTDI